MKKAISVFLTLIMICVATFSVKAQTEIKSRDLNETIVSTVIQDLGDGYVLEVVVAEQVNSVMPLSDTYTKTGSKTYTLKNDNGDQLVWFKLYGQFDITTGISSVCTSSWYSHGIVNDNWSLDSASTSKTANKAKGQAKFVRKVLFITAETRECSLILTCDTNGNLS